MKRCQIRTISLFMTKIENVQIRMHVLLKFIILHTHENSTSKHVFFLWTVTISFSFPLQRHAYQYIVVASKKSLRSPAKRFAKIPSITLLLFRGGSRISEAGVQM